MRDEVVLVAEPEDGDHRRDGLRDVTCLRGSHERALEISGVVVRAGHRGRGVGWALIPRGRPLRLHARSSLGHAQGVRSE